MNIADLSRKEIERFGEHVSLIFEDREITNVEMHKDAARLGNALKELGVKRGDRVIIQMPNCPEVVQSFHAVYSIGAVVVPINFLVGDAETAYIYQDTGAETIISSSEFLPKIEICRKEAPAVKHVILINEASPAQNAVLSYRELLKKSSEQLEIEKTDDDDLAALIYTAGTTGNPKGVMHTHGSLYSNAKMQLDTVELSPGIVTVSVLPLCHSYGIASMNYGALLGGGKTVLLQSFDLEKVFAAIEKYKAEGMAAVPTMYIYMLLSPQLLNYDIRSMKFWTCGSAPLTLDTWNNFKEKFGFEISEGWGLTEAGANNSVNPLQGKKKVGSIGLPMKGTTMKIIDFSGNELPDGEEGEIIISGPMLMKGYWNKPAETAEVLKDGWLYTGDIGYRDEEGYFFITGRKKDIIIKGGENIAPKEIEEVLFAHPKVSEAAVIGIKDEIFGENIKAFVVLMPGEKAQPEELIAHCAAKLNKFKLPKEVEFIDALPKNLVGKVLKKELRERG
ncbi:MAG: long-chain-fatty-acid--CoA ligase [Syntrophales bacterium]|jgi:long-chain acyl-CoA synthetase|nr:long-chain-fatty-acid--CoA ligase [Syntrophales bacterium]MDY0043942.1 long-chain-fatty-acid--CoA ligase [Syntrophales bacterium]